MTDIVMLNAVDLAAAIQDRRVSCVDVMEAYLAQMDRWNPMVNAIVSRLDPDSLRDQARERDRQLARGEYLGVLHGFPHAVKDLADVAGFVTTQGTPLLKDNVAPADSLFVERIRAAGAVFVGKTNVPEMGAGSHTFNPVFGTTYNAYDSTKTAGGSSGGTAAALAMRMLPVADGSDFAGSLRNPGAWNNLFSLRPSFGRVPHDGEAFVSQFMVSGPMGRTVPDVALLLSVMAGPDPRFPLSIEQDPTRFADVLERDFGGARIAWMGDFDGYLATEPGVLELCESSFAAFEQIGCVVEPVPAPMPPEQIWETFLTLRHWMISASAQRFLDLPGGEEALKPEIRWEIEGGRSLTALDVYRASAARAEWYRAVQRLLTTYDFILAPSAQVFPYDATLRWPDHINGRPMDTYHRWMEVVVPWTLTGLPVLNLPVGFNAAGLPMGVQVIG
ncbi:MAG: amidase, partial [Jiangellaceae bacterium]